MSVTTSSPNVSSTVDEKLRLRIAEELAGKFKGDIIGPDDAGYEQARTVWNAMVDKRPGLILRCTSTADVVAAVTVAREHDLPPSVRCGSATSTRPLRRTASSSRPGSCPRPGWAGWPWAAASAGSPVSTD